VYSGSVRIIYRTEDTNNCRAAFVFQNYFRKKVHFPIEKPTVAELIELSLSEKAITQKELAGNIGVSPSRINDYITGRSEPTLKVARRLCTALNIPPAAMLGV
jgi:HTH-type transcriptional regulator/antitoxin HigA